MSNSKDLSILQAENEKVNRVLAERAHKLAHAPGAERKGATVNLAVLRVGTGTYGVPLFFVDAIEHLRGLTPVPGLPPHWRGIVNLRGRLLPVLDLARHLGLVDRKRSDLAQDEETSAELVVVTHKHLSICLLVDSVAGVETVFSDDIAPPLGATSSGSSDFVSGSAPGLIAVLDVERLLTDPALTVQDEMQ